MSLSCKLILNDLERLPAVTDRRDHAAQMRLQGLPATIASRDRRVERLVRQCRPVEGDVLIKIVEVGPVGIALKGFGWSAVRKNDIAAFRLDMQIFKNIRLDRAQPGDAASIDQIMRWYQEAVYENAVTARHEEIAVGQIAIESAARDFDRGDFIIP